MSQTCALRIIAPPAKFAAVTPPITNWDGAVKRDAIRQNLLWTLKRTEAVICCLKNAPLGQVADEETSWGCHLGVRGNEMPSLPRQKRIER